MLIDTHCHLHDREFFTPEQAKTMLENAAKNHVEKIICIGTDPTDSLAAAKFAKNHPGVSYTYGIHPSESPTYSQSVEVATRTQAFGIQMPVAIGEIGLDYHYPGYNRTEQIQLFETMLQLAKDQNLPVSFHIREAFDDFFAVIANFPEVKGVVHSFSDSKKTLKKLLSSTDFYIGVNGLATYSTLPTPPLDRILLETDAPFLTPAPFRAIINEPAYIATIAAWLAAKLGVELKTVEKETTQNAIELFRLPDPIICTPRSV